MAKYSHIINWISFVSLTFVIIEENASDVPWNRWPLASAVPVSPFKKCFKKNHMGDKTLTKKKKK